jgi:hypothetical protein
MHTSSGTSSSNPGSFHPTFPFAYKPLSFFVVVVVDEDEDEDEDEGVSNRICDRIPNRRIASSNASRSDALPPMREEEQTTLSDDDDDEEQGGAKGRKKEHFDEKKSAISCFFLSLSLSLSLCRKTVPYCLGFKP